MAQAIPIREFASGLHTERHYTVMEISERWALSTHVVRELFATEPGVLVIGSSHSTGKKRKYTTLRVPESVIARVYSRLQLQRGAK